MKINILISGFQDDIQAFKEIQAQYKAEGKTAAYLFHEIMEAYLKPRK